MDNDWIILGRHSSVSTPLLEFTMVMPCWTVAEKNVSLSVLVFRHLADHVVEDASVVEIRQLHVRVESHPHLECFACVEL